MFKYILLLKQSTTSYLLLRELRPTDGCIVRPDRAITVPKDAFSKANDVIKRVHGYMLSNTSKCH